MAVKFASLWRSGGRGSHNLRCGMRINVAQQLKEAVGSVREYEVDEVGEGGLPVRGRVQLLRTNGSILVRGRLETAGRDECSRCLGEFEYPLALDIEEEYIITRDPTTGAPLDQPTEPGAFTVDENNEIDLGEAVRQYVLLAQPMKPICREDCAGLCPQCGRNLNCETCDCKQSSIDPAWAPLRKLLTGSRKRARKERG